MKRESLIVTVSTAILTAISLARWTLLETKTTINLSDSFFIVSAVFFILGAIIAITSNSRRHYYLHLKETYSAESSDEKDVKRENFSKEELRRKTHSKYGLLVATSGCIGILISALLTL